MVDWLMSSIPRQGQQLPRRRRLAQCIAVAAATWAAALPGWALDVDPMWDFAQPAASEQRFRAALAASPSADDALILQTQIARSLGLRGDFAQAQAILDAIQPQLATASAEAKVRHALESGRTLSSATHAPASQTPEVKASARAAYLHALDLARAAGLDALAIDALHMMAFVDTAPAEQLSWDLQALALAESSTQPAARKWEASLRNNTGYALHELGRYEEALVQFERAVVLRERSSDAEATRIAWWMVAWTLRAMARTDEAIGIQLRLEREGDAANAPDPEVFEELETLFASKGDALRAAHYAARREALAR
jgi:tetratricopeptide (TPR) repeat protein